jgi:hypothetical protein
MSFTVSSSHCVVVNMLPGTSGTLSAESSGVPALSCPCAAPSSTFPGPGPLMLLTRLIQDTACANGTSRRPMPLTWVDAVRSGDSNSRTTSGPGTPPWLSGPWAWTPPTPRALGAPGGRNKRHWSRVSLRSLTRCLSPRPGTPSCKESGAFSRTSSEPKVAPWFWAFGTV